MDWFLYDNGLRLERVKKYNFGAPSRTFKRFSLLNYRKKKTHHVYSTLKRRENGCFQVVSMGNTRGVFVSFLHRVREISFMVFTNIRFNSFMTERYLLYRNQSINLDCKSMGWFLYDSDDRFKRVKERCKHVSSLSRQKTCSRCISRCLRNPKITTKICFRFHRNCKKLRVEAKRS